MSATYFIDVQFFHEHGARLGGFFLTLLLRVGFGHQVQFPAGQFGREADVLTVAADRLREVLFVNDDVHAVFFFVHHDTGDFSRSPVH